MAKGAESKQKIMKDILNLYGNNAFLYNDGKEVRVNCMEGGELCQIKIAFTAAKEPVESGMDAAVPGSVASAVAAAVEFSAPEVSKPVAEPTPEEKHNVAELMALLGL